MGFDRGRGGGRGGGFRGGSGRGGGFRKCTRFKQNEDR